MENYLKLLKNKYYIFKGEYNMDINENLRNLRENKKLQIYELKYLKDKLDNDIKKVTDYLTEKYNEDANFIYNNINIYNNEIENILNDINKYSIFHVSEIKYAILDLIKIFTGENYEVQETYYHINPKSLIECEEILIYVKSNLKEANDYSFIKFHSLLKHNNALVFTYTDHSNRYIKFYDAYNNNIKQNAKYGKFNFVKDFIDELIKYKINYNTNEISDEEVETIKMKFIKSRLNEINDNYNNLYLKEQEEYKNIVDDKKISREKVLKRVLRKID